MKKQTKKTDIRKPQEIRSLIEGLTGRTLEEELERVANDPVLQAKFKPENRIGNTMFYGSQEDYDKWTAMGVKF